MHSLRHKIALFLGLSSFCTLLTAVAITVFHYEGKVRKQSAAELSFISRSMPVMIDAMGSGLSNLGRTISMSDEIVEPLCRGDAGKLRLCLKQFLNANHLNYTEITDSSGRVLLNLTDSSRIGSKSANPLVRTVLNNAFQSHGILRTNDRVYVVATQPIVKWKRNWGTITIGRSFDRDLIKRLENVPGVHFAIWLHPDQPALVAMGTDPLPPLTKLMRKDEMERLSTGGKIIKSLSLRGESFQAAYFTLRELNDDRLDFCATYRSLKFLKEAGQLTLVHIIALFLLILVVMAQFAWWISRRVTRPLTNLSRAARRMADLDFGEPVSIKGQDEISELARSFNNLAQHLQDSINQKDRYAAKLANLNENLECLVARRTAELEKANQRLKREMMEKEDFLRAVSHDLGAPLRNIGGLANILERKYCQNLSEEGRDRLNRIQNNVKNELQMIQQLLELSRIKTRRSRPEKIDLRNLLDQILQDLSYSIEEKGIQVALPDHWPVIRAEKNRIRQLFLNLIDNSIKYMGKQQNPRISLGWQTEASAYHFWIEDNGIGIPADQLNKIFGVFRRIKSQEVSSVEGKGVGLASVKTIVEMYGGEIWVDSTLGAGSTFHFTLALTQIAPETQDAASDRCPAAIDADNEADEVPS